VVLDKGILVEIISQVIQVVCLTKNL
jgi:hypothetical protein